MTKLSEMPFNSLQAGMRFKHPNYGEQIILDLGRNNFGPIIIFNNCEIYNGKIPEIGDEEEDLFQLLAKNTFPCGAEDWEYLGLSAPTTIKTCGWQWFEVSCPHCGSIHRLLAEKSYSNQRQCLICGMTHNRPLHPTSLHE